MSYKGAWQIIERANAAAPKTLVMATTGGSRGGGSILTEAGRALLNLFNRLEQQHIEFIEQLNRNLADDPDTFVLLQRQAIKTSACNQLFGRIERIIVGAVNVEIAMVLKGGTHVTTTISLAAMHELGIKFGAEAVLLINSTDITLVVDADPVVFSARNCLFGHVIRVHQDGINAEVIVLLPGGEMLTAIITPPSAQSLAVVVGCPIAAIFKTNVGILGVV